MKFLWLVVSLLLAIPALGQSAGEASKQFAAGNERLTNYQPASASDRMKWFVVSTAGPLSLLAAGPISAGFGTAINRPKEYGPHWEGFGKRYGMRLTGVSTGNAIEASLVWFDSERLESHQPYLLKHGTQIVNARITRVCSRTRIDTLQPEAVSSLGMNDIGVVELETTRPLFFDPYEENRATGNFILIDPRTNATAAAGMIRGALAGETETPAWGHKAAVLVLQDHAVAEGLEQALLAGNCAVVRTRVESKQVWYALLTTGVIVLADDSIQEARAPLAGVMSPSGNTIDWEVLRDISKESKADAISALLENLRRKGILSRKGRQL